MDKETLKSMSDFLAGMAGGISITAFFGIANSKQKKQALAIAVALLIISFMFLYFWKKKPATPEVNKVQ